MTGAERMAAHDAAVEALTDRLAPLSHRQARALAFAVVRLLLSTFAPRERDARRYFEAMHSLQTTLAYAMRAADVEDLELSAVAAEWLCSKTFAQAGDRGSWPLELRIPFDIATALHRACRKHAGLFVPLVVHGARTLLHEARVDDAALDTLISEALCAAAVAKEGRAA